MGWNDPLRVRIFERPGFSGESNAPDAAYLFDVLASQLTDFRDPGSCIATDSRRAAQMAVRLFPCHRKNEDGFFVRIAKSALGRRSFQTYRDTSAKVGLKFPIVSHSLENRANRGQFTVSDRLCREPLGQ